MAITSLLLLGGLQGGLLSSLILLKRKQHAANIYLAWFILLLALGALIDNNLVSISEEVFIWLWAGNAFLFGPLLLLYLVIVTAHRKVTIAYIFRHFSLYLVIKIMLIFLFTSGYHELPSVKASSSFFNLFLAGYHLIYGLLIVRVAWFGQPFPSAAARVWGHGLAYIFLLYALLLFIRRICTEVLSVDLSAFDNYVYVGALGPIYWMTYQLIHRPTLLKSTLKYQKSRLSEQQVKQIGNLIKLKLQDNRNFKDAELDVDKLSRIVAVPKHQISQTLSRHFRKSFHELITEVRIAEVTRMLASPQHNHLSILGVASECGFQSKSAFNKAFKKITGTTPSAYQKVSQSRFE